MTAKASREGLTLLQVAEMFGAEEKAQAWLEKWRWPNSPVCPHCGTDDVQCNVSHPRMTHRCRKCPGKPLFTMKIGTVMEGSKLKYRHWAIGIYLFNTNIKGISSMRLHRELGIGQKAAWFMLHRLREAFETETGQFTGPVEVNETYAGDKRKNMSNAKSQKEQSVGQGMDGKVAETTGKKVLHPFIKTHTDKAATVYTDDAAMYGSFPFAYEAVKHSASEYVRDQAYTNDIETFWAMLKRGYYGIYHKISPKHPDRHVTEFVGRHNERERDTVDHMRGVVRGMQSNRLSYDDLISDNGLPNGTRR